MATPVVEKRAKYSQSGWDLSELVADASSEAVQDQLHELETMVENFTQQREHLNSNIDAAKVTALVDEFEEILEKAYSLSAYGSLWFSEDTQSSDALTYGNNMQQRLTTIQNQMLFFDLWWKSLSDEEASSLLPDADSYPDQRFYLEDMRRTKRFTLREEAEQIINLKNANGSNALIKLYSMLTNRLEFTLTIDGNKETMSRAKIASYYQSPDPELRAAAYQEQYRVYSDEAQILAQIYVNRVQDWHSEQVTLRSYDSPIAVRNVANDIPDAATSALLDTVMKNAPVFQRYFHLKAKWLGVEKLRRYDIYAPLSTSDRQIPYHEAVELVLETFEDFHPRLRQQAQRVFDENHIDSEDRQGKRSGAFCATVLPSMTPWVLMSYTGKVRDVATLAHELGHAIHSMLAEEHSILTQHPTLPLAETASVFAEMLLTDKLLEQVNDPLARRDLLAAAIDDTYATVMRQAYFVRFEIDAHKAILENRSLDELNDLYMANLKDQFGDSVEIGPEFQHEWVSIPHIYNTPFYCYAYSFGQLLVLSLYRRFQTQGESFIPDYMKMLSYGGSARPVEILEEVGIDMEDSAFWQGGFDVISEMIDALEAIDI